MTLEEIHARCRREGGCLLWTGGMCNNTPRARVNDGRFGSVRQAVWRLTRPDEPTHMVAVTCGNARCLNPDHLRRGVSMEGARKPKPLPTAEELLARCRPQGECLLWPGSINGGTPKLTVGGKGHSLRPVVYAAHHPDWERTGLMTTCGEVRCLNPAHLTRHVRKPGPGRPAMAIARPRPAKPRPAKETKVRPIPAPKLRGFTPIVAASVPPNSPESFAICDAVRQEIVGPDKPGMARPWLEGRSA